MIATIFALLCVLCFSWRTYKGDELGDIDDLALIALGWIFAFIAVTFWIFDLTEGMFA